VYILLLIFELGILSSSIFASDYIAVNNRAIKLTSSTKCKQLDTADPQDICDCCLLKYTYSRGENNNRALEICQNKGECSRDINYTSMQALQAARTNLTPFEVVNITALNHAPKIPHDGLLKEETVLEILSTLTENNFLPAFMKNLALSCFKIKALGEQAKGVHTGQLFAISINTACFPDNKTKNLASWRNLYILKESKKGYSELRNLYRVRSSVLGAEYVPTSQRLFETQALGAYGIARVTFEDLHFKLENHGHFRYFSLLQTAKGKSLQSQLQEFGKNIARSDLAAHQIMAEIAQTKDMFYRIGYSMSKLHQKYAIKGKVKTKNLGKTYIHGDFHAQNVFYDHASGEVTLIDNETFALSLRKRTSGVNDIVDLYLLHTIKTIAHMFTDQLITNRALGINDALWHELWHDLFLGYILAYEFTDKKSIRRAYFEFRSKFYEGLSNAQLFDSLRNFKDQRVLKRFGPSWRRFYTRERALNQAFAKLKQSLKI
jgi:hypothetical protein